MQRIYQELTKLMLKPGVHNQDTIQINNFRMQSIYLNFTLGFEFGTST